MEMESTAYLLPLILSAVVSALLAWFAWRRRPAPGAVSLAVLMAAVTVWTAGYALRLGSMEPADKIFWAKARYLGVVVTPAAWLVFAIQYSGYGRRWLAPWTLGLLALEPLAVLALVWTNEYHHLFWTEMRLEPYGPLTLLVTSHGPAFWVHLIYSYALLLAGSAILVLVAVRSPGLYREQAVALLVAPALPLLGSILSIFGLVPLPLDLVPFGFTLTGLVLAWGLFRSRLLEVTPVARDAIIEVMPGAALVLDVQGRFVDLNPIAERILGLSASEAIGAPAEGVLSRYPALFDLLRREEPTVTEIALDEEVYEARLSPLRDPRGRIIGKALFLHEITERKRAEQVLRRSVERLRLASEVARMAATERDVVDLVGQVVQRVRDHLNCDAAALFLLDEAGRYLILFAGAGEDRMLAEEGRRWRTVEAGLAGEAYRSGQARLSRDLDAEGVSPRGPRIRGASSEVAVPLQVGGRVIGVLDVQSRQPGAFDENDVTTLQAVADQVAAFIENTRLVREMEMTVRELEAATGKAAHRPWVSLGIDRPVGYRFRGVTVEPVEEVSPEALRAVREGQPVTVPPSEAGDGREGTGVIAFPLQVRGQTIGALDLRFRGTSVPPDLLAMAQAIADRLALALENARLLEETRRRAALEQLRAEIAARVRASTDVETVLRTAVRELGRALRASEGLIRLESRGPAAHPPRGTSPLRAPAGPIRLEGTGGDSALSEGEEE